MLSRMSISTCGRLFRISSVHLLSVASPSSSNHSNHYVYHNSLRHFSSSISSDKNPSVAKGNSAHSGKHQKKNLIYLRPLEKFEVIFVGTGGVTRSSKFRGNSCIALKLDGRKLWLFDTGEGSLRQTHFIKSCSHPTKIFISSLHPMRVSGLLSFLMDSRILASRTVHIDVYGPPGIYDYVKCVFQLSEWNGANAVTVHEMAFDDQQLASLPDGLFPWKHTNKRKIVNHSFDEKLNLRYKALFPDKDGYWSLWKETQVTVTAGLVSHNIPSYGFVVEESPRIGKIKSEVLAVTSPSERSQMMYNDVITVKDKKIRIEDAFDDPIRGRKLSIVGSTCDASSLSGIARDSDVLIHECFTDDSKWKDAAARATPTIAAISAEDLNARTLVLTNFSVRHVPVFNKILPDTKQYISSDRLLFDQAKEALKNSNKHVILAKDFMIVDIPKINQDSEKQAKPFYYFENSNSNQTSEE